MNEKARCLGALLMERHLTVATAESCTAGGIGATIASVDGASNYFIGGVIAYSADLKEHILGVSSELISECGIVSREVAEAMNDGVRQLTHADIAISITGYIGANGGDKLVPNGVVWVCTGSNKTKKSVMITVCEDRAKNASTAIDAALSLAMELCQLSES